MGLISFHIGFSVLCCITVLGMRVIGNKVILENGYKKINVFKAIFMCCIPIMNIVSVLGVLIMISYTKETFDTYIENRKGN